jgi:hypothetical protein
MNKVGFYSLECIYKYVMGWENRGSSMWLFTRSIVESFPRFQELLFVIREIG